MYFRSQKKRLFQKSDQIPNDYSKVVLIDRQTNSYVFWWFQTSDKNEDLLRILNEKRNMYLLSLAALKEHQKRYFKVDIAALAKVN